MTECLEATFDFLRANRRVWFRSMALLFLPICVVVSLLMFSSLDRDAVNKDVFFWFDYFFNNLDNYTYVFLFLMYLGVWMVFVQVHSLLLANEEYDEGVEGLSLMDLKPWFIRTAMRSWYLPLFFLLVAILLSSSSFLAILLMVLMVPMALLPSLCLIRKVSLVEAVTKSLSMGFPIWFKLAVNIALVSMLGAYVFLVLFLPTGFFTLMIETFSTSKLHELEKLFVIGMGFVFTVLALFGLFVVFSMVVLVCAYHYGSLSEEKDASSVEGEVADFGN